MGSLEPKFLHSEQAFHVMNDRQPHGVSEDMRAMMIAETTSAISSPDLQKPLVSFIIMLHEEFADLIKKEYLFCSPSGRAITHTVCTKHASSNPHFIQ